MMPIKPENLHHYQAPEFLAARARIVKRAGGKCELCFIRNGERIYRAPNGEPWTSWQVDQHPELRSEGWTHRPIRIVLTVAHINQDPADNRDINLLHLCQRCHNKIDLPHRQRNAEATRKARG